jgi:hypothetical protein
MPIVLDFFRKPPLCNICNKPLDLKIAVTDQDGKPIHEECYVAGAAGGRSEAAQKRVMQFKGQFS